MLLEGEATLDGHPLTLNTMVYLGTDRSELALHSANGGRVLVVGGEPFREPVLMWWNFVARTPDEIAAARTEWEEGEAFGVVPHYDGPRLHAPSLMKLAQPNPAS
jgi:redox-sensitive bicupin YhaK (pirin superfamily)